MAGERLFQNISCGPSSSNRIGAVKRARLAVATLRFKSTISLSEKSFFIGSFEEAVEGSFACKELQSRRPAPQRRDWQMPSETAAS